MLLRGGTVQNYSPEPISADELFSGLTPRQKKELASLTVRKQLLPKTSVFASGEMPLRIYVHHSGRAILFDDNGLKNVIDARPVESDWIYGIVEALLEKPLEISIETLSRCEFDVIDRDDFLRFIRDQPLLCFRLVERLCRMYQGALQEIRSY